MKFVGIILVVVCTVGGFFAGHGKMSVITHIVLPAMLGEMIIIFGIAVSAFIIANSMEVIKKTMSYFKALSKPHAYKKDDYIELLSVLFMVFKLARTKGWLALEAHIEKPEESSLFTQFPGFAHNHHALIFLCDYLRIISLGNDKPHEIENLMDQEIENFKHHEEHPGHAIQTMADGIPALGIVAAVLGVIKTMASISEPPEVLGKLIGGALVGTFLGVWLSYSFIAPIAGAMKERASTEVLYFLCIKVGIIAFLSGAAPQVAVEFARKFLPHDVQPEFLELEEKLNALPAPG
ncbi:MAG: flagellar motor stator protein MotA [Alphaproteobacteria bacterium]|nr:flagellar motor stator protein MotA [Alphaproteobacteria bacterium]